MGGYGKLWSGITESSLWGGSKEARLLFVTLLAKADATGFVEAAPSGLARLANLTRAEIDIALSELTAPDPESKSKVADGRRVAIVPRGVCLVNYEEYRKRRDDEERKEYMKIYMRKYRQENTSLKGVNPCKQGKLQLAQAEAEAEEEEEEEKEKEKDSSPTAQEPSLFPEEVKKKSSGKVKQKSKDPDTFEEILGGGKDSQVSKEFWKLSELWPESSNIRKKDSARAYMKARKEANHECILAWAEWTLSEIEKDHGKPTALSTWLSNQDWQGRQEAKTKRNLGMNP